FSLPSNFGTSTPASRAETPREKSAAICTCLSSGNMSGASRACNSASGSIDLVVAYSLACARMVGKAVSICLKTGTEWVYIALVMGVLRGVNEKWNGWGPALLQWEGCQARAGLAQEHGLARMARAG